MTQVSGEFSPLSVLGITRDQEEVYRVVLRSASLSLVELGELLAVAEATLREDVARLAALGLVDLRGDEVVALAPDLALAGLITEETRRLRSVEEQLESLRRLLPSLRAEHLSSQAPKGQPVPVELLAAEDVVDLVRSLSPGAAGDMLWLRPDQWRSPQGPQADAAVMDMMRSGRRSRAIYPARILELAPDVLRGRADAGEDVRVLADVPFRLGVIGDVAAVLGNPDDQRTDRAVVVRQDMLLRTVRAYFEALWERAMAVPGVGGYDGGQNDRALLLDQLAGGAKDEQIARALGLSLRTVRRRVAEIMEELGVDSRFQAGVEAVRRGWV